MDTPVTMHVAVEEYLTWRRKLGFALRIEGEELGRFARFADQVGHRGPLTTELAVRWATLPAAAARLYHARRLDMVRRLARHLVVVEPTTEIPPAGFLGPSYRRREPHIYSREEIAALLGAAAQLDPAGGFARGPTRRSSVCSPVPGYAFPRPSAWRGRTSTSTPGSSPSPRQSFTSPAWSRSTRRPCRRCAATPSVATDTGAARARTRSS